MEQLDLNWHTYNDHLKEMMQNLFLSNESSDITLVCGDKAKFKAHKFVLNACSPVFTSIINELPEKDPVIYLRGVCASEMKSILQFMYLGKATFYQDRMNDFLNIARSLEIKEISKDVDHSVPDSQYDQDYDNNIDPNIGDLQEEETFLISSNDGETEHISSKVISQNEADQFPCSRCDKHFKYRQSLNRHIQYVHKGIKFPCNECGYEATERPSLLRHIQNVHEGIKFPCDFCDFKASRKDKLQSHKKNKHYTNIGA